MKAPAFALLCSGHLCFCCQAQSMQVFHHLFSSKMQLVPHCEDGIVLVSKSGGSMEILLLCVSQPVRLATPGFASPRPCHLAMCASSIIMAASRTATTMLSGYADCLLEMPLTDVASCRRSAIVPMAPNDHQQLKICMVSVRLDPERSLEMKFTTHQVPFSTFAAEKHQSWLMLSSRRCSSCSRLHL